MSRNIILGGLFVVWGLAILINRLAAGGGDEGSGAYNVGQDAAFYFAMVMVGVGSFALRKGLRERAETKAPPMTSDPAPPRPLTVEEEREKARERSSVAPPG
jgi:hypothetical protein